ncbi:MAG: ATP-binding cassette domain-containing protein, partial [Clostridia bacterium]|nr:ATP-binding cassette domain-containing protein [Clostridia bacterium]
MLQTIDLALEYGGRTLFKNANLMFTEGNCYGIIGANGAGKSTLLRILSGEEEPSRGSVAKTPGQRMSVLKQDQFLYDDKTVIEAVICGNEELVDIMEKKEVYYAKENMTEEEGMELSALEERFAELDGWNAEYDAALLLNGLGIPEEYHYTLMAEMPAEIKVKVLLAQALFGHPDILLMDEPTNHLDLKTIAWLENFLLDIDSTVLVVSHD